MRFLLYSFGCGKKLSRDWYSVLPSSFDLRICPDSVSEHFAGARVGLGLPMILEWIVV